MVDNRRVTRLKAERGMFPNILYSIGMYVVTDGGIREGWKGEMEHWLKEIRLNCSSSIYDKYRERINDMEERYTDNGTSIER